MTSTRNAIRAETADDRTSAERAMAALEESAPDAPGKRRLTDIRQLAIAPSGQLLVEPRWSADGKTVYCTEATTGKTYQILVDGKLVEITDPSKVPPPAGTDAGETAQGESVRTSAPSGTRSDEELEKDASIVGAFVRDGQPFVRSKPGEVPRSLPTGEDRISRATLSPDGKLIALTSPHTGIHIVQATDGSAVADLGDGEAAQWLPNGSGVIYRWSQVDEMGKPILGDLFMAGATDNWQVSNLTQSLHSVEQDFAISADANSVLYSENGGIYLGQLK